MSGLADERAWRGLDHLLSRLPAVWAWGCFEVRLAADDPQVDYSCCVCREGGGQDALAAALRAGEEVLAGELVRPVLEEWSRPGTLLAESVPVVWLEYDLPGGEVQAPCLFFTFMGLARREAAPSPARLRSLAEAGLRLVPGRSGDGPRLALLERCAAILPPGGRVYHVGTLPAWRGSQALRLNAFLPSPAALREWLSAAGWQVEPRSWNLALELLGDEEEHCQIGLDLEGELVRRLALETPRTTIGRQRLERLVERGLADRQKAEAVLGWSGSDRLWRGEAGFLLRVELETSAIKIVVDAAGRAHAKAYLAFRPRYALF
ncbi:MAG TPA: hypothetical protein VE078_09650 [Thermoanaerobaculia bacterium]|nr:hypothetical protein [Thermoanaerobaculia bacterium]